jgi:hypothetical protein
MSVFLKAERIVSTALGLLLRESTLPRLVWRDAAGDFAGAKNDTISIRLPAYAPARTRDLRSGTTRTRDTLTERKVDVTLDTGVYKDIRITDEQLTLDIANFGAQVLNPVVGGVVQTLEDELAATIEGATYAKTVSFTIASDDPWTKLILPARTHLNKAHIPQAGRVLLVGAAIEEALLGHDMFAKANESGSTDALTEAVIGRKAGFTIVSSPAIAPNAAYAFHKTAYVMNQRAPIVPAGASFGASMSHDGMALRVVRVLDSDTIEDILALDAWVGCNTVADAGYFTAQGLFVPAEGAVGAAVTLDTSAAADDIIDTATAHGYVAGDKVVFTSLTGGAGLTANQVYYVIAGSLGAQTFKVSATPGGSAVNFTTDITAGTVRKNGAELLVRSVKIAGS